MLVELMLIDLLTPQNLQPLFANPALLQKPIQIGPTTMIDGTLQFVRFILFSFSDAMTRAAALRVPRSIRVGDPQSGHELTTNSTPRPSKRSILRPTYENVAIPPLGVVCADLGTLMYRRYRRGAVKIASIRPTVVKA